MTYAELLAEIDSLNDSCSVVEQLTTALRAVVELHKPFEIDREGNYNCQECEWEYPCPTIQAIEKELRGKHDRLVS